MKSQIAFVFVSLIASLSFAQSTSDTSTTPGASAGEGEKSVVSSPVTTESSTAPSAPTDMQTSPEPLQPITTVGPKASETYKQFLSLIEGTNVHRMGLLRKDTGVCLKPEADMPYTSEGMTGLKAYKVVMINGEEKIILPASRGYGRGMPSRNSFSKLHNRTGLAMITVKDGKLTHELGHIEAEYNVANAGESKIQFHTFKKESVPGVSTGKEVMKLNRVTLEVKEIVQVPLTDFFAKLGDKVSSPICQLKTLVESQKAARPMMRPGGLILDKGPYHGNGGKLGHQIESQPKSAVEEGAK